MAYNPNQQYSSSDYFSPQSYPYAEASTIWEKVQRSDAYFGGTSMLRIGVWSVLLISLTVLLAYWPYTIITGLLHVPQETSLTGFVALPYIFPSVVCISVIYVLTLIPQYFGHWVKLKIAYMVYSFLIALIAPSLFKTLHISFSDYWTVSCILWGAYFSLSSLKSLLSVYRPEWPYLGSTWRCLGMGATLQIVITFYGVSSAFIDVLGYVVLALFAASATSFLYFLVDKKPSAASSKSAETNQLGVKRATDLFGMLISGIALISSVIDMLLKLGIFHPLK
jgi:hypothetical protein